MHFQQSVGLYMWPAYKYFQNYAHEVKQKKKSINYEASGNREMSTDNSYSENPNSVSKLLLFLILNEAQHVSGDTPPIIRSLKLHKRPLVLHDTVEGCRTCSCWTFENLPRYHAKPEAACAVLGSW